MTTLLDRIPAGHLATLADHDFTDGPDRRAFRRAELEAHGIAVNRFQGNDRPGKPLGQIVDLSAGGVRIRTRQKDLRADAQIRLQLELPDYAGISPFIDRTGSAPQPKRQWVGWMAISRVEPVSNGEVDVAGRLVDMDEMNRGMLSLYLSTQPLAA